MVSNPSKVRSIYRAFLRELPFRGSCSGSPLQDRIRAALSTDSPTSVEGAEQFLQYVKAQRMYTTLLERYNPGMHMEDDDRIRLTAKRVGMDLPQEYKPSSKE
jgi:ATP synthase assembly factor FMC1, mitochondrial